MWNKSKKPRVEEMTVELSVPLSDIDVKRAELLRAYRNDLVQSLDSPGRALGRAITSSDDQKRIKGYIDKIDEELLLILTTHQLTPAYISGGLVSGEEAIDFLDAKEAIVPLNKSKLKSLLERLQRSINPKDTFHCYKCKNWSKGTGCEHCFSKKGTYYDENGMACSPSIRIPPDIKTKESNK